MKSCTLLLSVSIAALSAAAFAQTAPTVVPAPAADTAPAPAQGAAPPPAADAPARRGGPPDDRHHQPGAGMRGERRGGMMRYLDTDRDGTVSRAEMEAAHQRHMRAFDRADANHDGKLTPQEMRALWQDRRPGRGAGAGATRPGAPSGPYAPN